MKSEIGRFPRLFRAVESVPGLTWPTLAFKNEMTLWMGKLEVKILQVGRGHSKGDTIVWLPSQKVLFAGDFVEYGATPYCDDAYILLLANHIGDLDVLRDALKRARDGL